MDGQEDEVTAQRRTPNILPDSQLPPLDIQNPDTNRRICDTKLSCEEVQRNGGRGNLLLIQLYNLKQENRKLLKSSQTWYMRFEELHRPKENTKRNDFDDNMMIEQEFTSNNYNFIS